MSANTGDSIRDTTSAEARALTDVRVVIARSFGAGETEDEYFGSTEAYFTSAVNARTWVETQVAEDAKYSGDFAMKYEITEALCMCGYVATIIHDSRYPYCAECWGVYVAQEHGDILGDPYTVAPTAGTPAEGNYAQATPESTAAAVASPLIMGSLVNAVNETYSGYRVALMPQLVIHGIRVEKTPDQWGSRIFADVQYTADGARTLICARVADGVLRWSVYAD